MSAVAEAVAIVDWPVTERVPLDVSEEVAVRVPKVAELPESVVMNPVTALRSVARKLVEVAFVLVRLLIVPVVAKSVLIVPTVVDDVLSTV